MAGDLAAARQRATWANPRHEFLADEIASRQRILTMLDLLRQASIAPQAQHARRLSAQAQVAAPRHFQAYRSLAAADLVPHPADTVGWTAFINRHRAALQLVQDEYTAAMRTPAASENKFHS